MTHQENHKLCQDADRAAAPDYFSFANNEASFRFPSSILYHTHLIHQPSRWPQSWHLPGSPRDHCHPPDHPDPH